MKISSLYCIGVHAFQLTLDPRARPAIITNMQAWQVDILKNGLLQFVIMSVPDMNDTMCDHDGPSWFCYISPWWQPDSLILIDKLSTKEISIPHLLMHTRVNYTSNRPGPWWKSINGQQIEHVDEAKYIGVTIDSELTWKKHVAKKTKGKKLA